MKKTLMLAVLAVSSLAFAAAPAPMDSKTPAPTAAPAPVVAKDPKAAAGVTAPDCDMHKAEAAMMKDIMTSKAKVEMVKLDNGTTTIIMTDAKNGAAVEKAMMAMEGHMKEAVEGKAKLCDECKHKLEAMKAGKVLGGKGHQANVWTMSMLSNDPEIVKMMHAEADTKAMPAPKAAPAKK